VSTCHFFPLHHFSSSLTFFLLRRQVCNYTSKQQALLEAKGEGTKQTRKYTRGSTSSSTGRRLWRHKSIPSSIPSYIPSSIPSSSITPPDSPSLVQPFLTGEKFQQKEKLNLFFFENEVIFSRFSKSPELRENIIKNFQIIFIYLFSFHCVAKRLKVWLGFCSSYMVYSHIWLNLPMDDPHLFYNFLLMITSLAKKQNKKQKILK